MQEFLFGDVPYIRLEEGEHTHHSQVKFETQWEPASLVVPGH
jgi:hypothetical protein